MVTKHSKFVAKCDSWLLGCDAIAGIGPANAKKMKEQGLEIAWQVIEKYLLFDRDEQKLNAWLKGTVQLKDKHAKDATKCIVQWCDIFIKK